MNLYFDKMQAFFFKKMQNFLSGKSANPYILC